MIDAALIRTFFLFVILSGLAARSADWVLGPQARTLSLPMQENRSPGFLSRDPHQIGLVFTNVMVGDFYLTNAVAHNGSGVAMGDVDGDGLTDVYLCSLQGPNRLFRNQGSWRFESMELGEAACASQSSTGACFADVDGDSDLDLLVNGIAAGTRLFINDGLGHFTEAQASGLSTTASATSMALADIDGDGDLDLYCTHFIDVMRLADPTTRFALSRRGDQWEVSKVNGESTRSPKWKGRFEASPDGKVREWPEADGFYRNNGHGQFTAIQNELGIFSTADGKPIPPYRDWGLAVMFRDMNGDGIPDIYVCNDNTSPDRIWINSGTGTFKEADPTFLRHTSRSSMGVDFGDLDRDGQDDFFVVDMLARGHPHRMTQLVRDRPLLAELERVDERPQFNRNTLFFGRSGGGFFEAALMSGVAATDWTWSPLFIDVDLDGYEDILVTNGFEFDVMDQDSSLQIKHSGKKLTEAQLKRSMQYHPHWRSRNVGLHNLGDGRFEESSTAWGFDLAGVSYGMAAGDLDNDGDLDLVVNNLNAPATIYENKSSAPRIGVRLVGQRPNTQGIGAKIVFYSDSITQSQEMIAGGRYLSADQAQRVFASDPKKFKNTRLEVTWRSGFVSRITNSVSGQIYQLTEPNGVTLPSKAAQSLKPPFFEDVSARISHRHSEEEFDDWLRQPTLPRRLSRLGPSAGWFDWDGDGWEDLFITSGRGGALSLYRNQSGEGWTPVVGAPMASGDQAAAVGWSDGQGHRRILVASSNYEQPARTESFLEIYNPADLAHPERIPAGPAALGALALADIDGDGDLDVFVGGRCQALRYPEPVASQVWMNEKGKLILDPVRSRPFARVGMVTGATFADIDGNGIADLVLGTEWGPVRLFLNHQGVFTEATKEWGLEGINGLWTGVVVGDFDGDGRLDLACGNWGNNSIYELYRPKDIRLFYGDWGQDGVVRVLEAWRSGTQWFPVHDRTWLETGFPNLSAEFKTHAEFSRATVNELLKLDGKVISQVEGQEFSSTVFLQRNGRFKPIPLPKEAQLTPIFSIQIGEINGDEIEDIFCSQNFFGTASDLSREDGGLGLWLQGMGDGTFKALPAQETGVRILGEQRGASVGDFNHDGRLDLVVSQNSGMTRLYENRRTSPGLRVVLKGSTSNPEAIGAVLRLNFADGHQGPVRLVTAGSGYWSQAAAVQVMGRLSNSVSLQVQWPDGKIQTVPIKTQDSTIPLEIQR